MHNKKKQSDHPGEKESIPFAWRARFIGRSRVKGLGTTNESLFTNNPKWLLNFHAKLVQIWGREKSWRRRFSVCFNKFGFNGYACSMYSIGNIRQFTLPCSMELNENYAVFIILGIYKRYFLKCCYIRHQEHEKFTYGYFRKY